MKTDTLYIKAISSDGQHDYLSEIDPKEYKSKDANTNSNGGYSASHTMEQALKEFFANDLVRGISFVVLFAFLAIIAYNLIKHFAYLEPNVSTEAKDMGDDTIYGHSWKDEIKELMDKGNFSEAVVLCYLHLLETLDKRGVIDFMESKTPNMFLDEANAYSKKEDEDMIRKDYFPPLQTLTNHYLLIRYGHKKATEQTAKEMVELDERITNEL